MLMFKCEVIVRADESMNEFLLVVWTNFSVRRYKNSANESKIFQLRVF